MMETDRLLLRNYSGTDKEIQDMLKNWVADPAVQAEYGEPVYETYAAVRELLDRYMAEPYRWAVWEKKSGECIGQVAFCKTWDDIRTAEIEYCIGTGFQKRGYATEATKALISYGFEKIGLHKVQICARPVNQSSWRVIEKCGFTYEGTLRDYFFKDNHYESRMYFSILQSEYLEKK